MRVWSIIKRILMVLLFLILPLTAIAYPFVSNFLFDHRTASQCSAIDKQIDNVDDEIQEEEHHRADVYNQTLANGHVVLTDPFDKDITSKDAEEYESLCNVTGNGVMGTIEIPLIKVNLPIYHGTSEDVLEKGVGHLQGTSLPVGGESTHTVLTGHTGLSSAKLFTDLVQLKKGNIFFVHTFGEKLAYKVDDIQVVWPDEMDSLKVYPGCDYCTLITCTPYGVNDHRLLVRGVRTDYEEAVEEVKTEEPVQESRWMEEYKKALVIGFGAFFLIIASAYTVMRVRDRTAGL